jgi:hypothetical protein
MSLVQSIQRNRTAVRAASLAALLGTAVITFALAQPLPDGSTSPGGLISDSQLTDGYAAVVDSANRVRHMKVKPGQHAMLMKLATPQAPGTVIYRTGGHYYMATHPQLSDPAFYESNLPE